MQEDVHYEINQEETKEIFATLIGYVIFNHERLNVEIIAAIEIIDRKLEIWRNLNVNKPTQARDEDMLSREHEYNPYQTYTKQLPDAELRLLFHESLKIFCNIQQNLSELPIWFSDFADTLTQCLKAENQLRNELIHSGFSFSRDNEPLQQITTKRRIRNAGKRKGSFEVTTIDRDVVIEFLSFQSDLINFLSDFTFAETEEDFGCDYVRLLQNSERFEERYVNYARIWFPFDEYNEDQIEFARTEGIFEEHDDVLNYWKRFCDELTQIDNLRRNLKLKSKNVDYRYGIFDIYSD